MFLFVYGVIRFILLFTQSLDGTMGRTVEVQIHEIRRINVRAFILYSKTNNLIDY